MKPWIKITFAFIVGLLFGGAATGFYIHHCFCRAWVNSGSHEHAVGRLASELGLDKGQTEQVGKIFDEQKPQMDLVRQETNAKLKTLRDATDGRISKVLRPDQLKKFEDLRAKWDERMAKDGNGWHIPGLPPGPNSPPACSTPNK